MSVHLFELTGRGKIKASGEDRKRLLHAMTTNHIEKLAPGDGAYAYFLNAQGRILTDANIFALDDYLLIDTGAGTRQLLLDHLDKFIIADDVTLEDVSEEFTTLCIEGEGAAELLPLSPPSGIADWAGRWIANLSYTGLPGYWIFVSPLDAPIVREALLAAGAAEITLPQADALRIETGRPLYGVDITAANLPQETQQARALHFNKGCYLGQEIVERVRSRGHVNRLLVHLRIEGSPAPGAKILAGDKEAGQITSAAHPFALGYLRADAIAGKQSLTVDGSPAQVIE